MAIVLAVLGLAAWPVNASTWTVETTPNAATGQQYDQNSLGGVDCASAKACMAVGYSDANNASTQEALAMRWDGAAWHLAVPSEEASLSGVSCPSDSRCFAAGTSFPDGRHGAPVIVRWSHQKWSSAKLPTRKSQVEQDLEGIDCPTTTSCLAVGATSNGPGTPFHTLVYRYNGSTWSIIKSPNPSSAPAGNVFQDVSCVSATKCFLIGTAGEQMLVERWNGTGWKRQHLPALSGNAFLNGISCSSASACVAVGYIGNSDGSQQTLALVYNGTSWQRHLTAKSPIAYFSDVSCTTAACVAVGTRATTQGQAPYVVKYATGKWHPMSAPSGGSALTNYLAVGCWSGASCQAVGSKTNDNNSYRTFAAVHP